MTEVHDQPTASTAPIFRPRIGSVLIVLALIGIGVYLLVTLTHHSHVSASQVASEANADSCSDSGFYLVSRLDSSKQTVFDCSFSDGSEKCVTEHGGIASDATEEVRIVFATALGGEKPSCLG